MKAPEHKIRDGIYYSRDHEWVKKEGNLARVGITDYAQGKLGDIVYVELPTSGKQVKQVSEQRDKDMELGAVESVKAVSVIYSPLSGTVKEVNTSLQDKSELVNTSPYDDGWICIISSDNLETKLKTLMDAKSYSEYLKTLE